MMRTIFLASCMAFIASSGPSRAEIRYAVEHYTSGDAAVEIECFAPASTDKHPAILLLHGSGGLEQATHGVFRGMAKDLAAKGYAVFIPHYFDRTNHVPGQPIRQDEQVPFMKAIEDAVKFVTARDEVDAENLGILGMSMGAGLAFTRGALDKRVKAVVSLSGSLPIGSRAKFPPTLILHGSKDAGTPVKYIRKFEDQLKANDTPVVVKIYAGVGHNFAASEFPEIARRSGIFFDKYLKPIDPAREKAVGATKKKS